MALHSNPPHRVDVYTVASGTDAGGGVALTYSTDPVQTACPCSINTASSSEREQFAQMQLVVTHTVGFLASALTTALSPGMKLKTSDRLESYHVKGISYGRAYGTIPAFTYAFCESQL